MHLTLLNIFWFDGPASHCKSYIKMLPGDFPNGPCQMSSSPPDGVGVTMVIAWHSREKPTAAGYDGTLALGGLT